MIHPALVIHIYMRSIYNRVSRQADRVAPILQYFQAVPRFQFDIPLSRPNTDCSQLSWERLDTDHMASQVFLQRLLNQLVLAHREQRIRSFERDRLLLSPERSKKRRRKLTARESAIRPQATSPCLHSQANPVASASVSIRPELFRPACPAGFPPFPFPLPVGLGFRLARLEPES